MNENQQAVPSSIWDGWEKQCFEVPCDEHGARCATGYLAYMVLFGQQARAVGRYLQANYDLPDTYLHPKEGSDYHPKDDPLSAIVYANNVLRLTPEQFREIDRLTQIEAAVKPLVDSIDVPEKVTP